MVGELVVELATSLVVLKVGRKDSNLAYEWVEKMDVMLALSAVGY